MTIKEIIDRYRKDKIFKARFALWRGASVDVVYSVFRIITGLIYFSKWFITLALYHVGLCFIRIMLIRSYDKVSADCETHDKTFEYKRYRLAAIFMLVLTLPLLGMATLTVAENAAFRYPGLIIYASAAYTCYITVMAIINISRYKKVGSPILMAAKAVNLVAAAVSIFGLQTAMIARFSPGDEVFRLSMNASTGAAMILGVLAIAVYMIVISTKKIKNIGNEQIGEQIL